MGAVRKLRLHYGDGRVVVEPLTRTARENNTTAAGAKSLIAGWVKAGDLKPRPDGGYDVVRYRPRAGAR